MTCELCGKEAKGCRPAIIDGVKMMLCPDCIKHGEGIKEIRTPTTSQRKTTITHSKKTQFKDIYKNIEKELISNWSEKIKKARLKKGLTREKLGFNIGERTVTISKIENGDLRPSDKIVAKLEKELEIKLMEEIKPIHTPSGQSNRGMTLGDFIKHE